MENQGQLQVLNPKALKIANLPQLSIPNDDDPPDAWIDYINSDSGLSGLFRAMTLHRGEKRDFSQMYPLTATAH